MRLGGPIFSEWKTPKEWAKAVKNAGYSATFCPLDPETDIDTARAFEQAAKDADIVIAEVGAWSNPLSRDPKTAAAALVKCKRSLALADTVGARCCVNIAGSRGAKWDGPCAEDLTEETFERIVVCVQDIIDSVKPSRTFYTLEPMPWMFPDSADSYLRLIEAVDRKAFGVHLDPVNLINSPRKCFNNGELLVECFEKLGPRIKSCHAKDIALGENLTTHLDEVRPGLGTLDFATYLRELDRLGDDVPLLIEHLPSETEFRLAAEHIRSVARREGLTL